MAGQTVRRRLAHCTRVATDLEEPGLAALEPVARADVVRRDQGQRAVNRIERPIRLSVLGVSLGQDRDVVPVPPLGHLVGLAGEANRLRWVL